MWCEPLVSMSFESAPANTATSTHRPFSFPNSFRELVPTGPVPPVVGGFFPMASDSVQSKEVDQGCHKHPNLFQQVAREHVLGFIGHVKDIGAQSQRRIHQNVNIEEKEKAPNPQDQIKRIAHESMHLSIAYFVVNMPRGITWVSHAGIVSKHRLHRREGKFLVCCKSSAGSSAESSPLMSSA